MLDQNSWRVYSNSLMLNVATKYLEHKLSLFLLNSIAANMTDSENSHEQSSSYIGFSAPASANVACDERRKTIATWSVLLGSFDHSCSSNFLLSFCILFIFLVSELPQPGQLLFGPLGGFSSGVAQQRWRLELTSITKLSRQHYRCYTSPWRAVDRF